MNKNLNFNKISVDSFALKFKKHWCHIAQWFPFVLHFYFLLSFPRICSVCSQLWSWFKSLTSKCSQSDKIPFLIFTPWRYQFISFFQFSNCVILFSLLPGQDTWSAFTVSNAVLPLLNPLLICSSASYQSPALVSFINYLSCWKYHGIFCHIFTVVHNNFTYYLPM